MNARTSGKLEFADGLRGLAALYVVAYHALLASDHTPGGWRHTFPAGVERYLHWLDQGHTAVDIFIVLSGFCLMIPVAKNAEGKLAGGFLGYILRRSRRILPPYFAALAICLAGIALIPALQAHGDVFWNITMPAFSPAVLLSHLFLVHNLSPNLSSRIDYPLWSVAMEWQIYFLFPLLILPLWRRFNIVVSVLVALCLSLVPHYLFKGAYDYTAPQYLGLFAMGAGASLICNSNAKGWRTLARRVPWGWLTLLAWGPLLALALTDADLFIWRRVMMDLLLGAATGILLIHCTVTRRDGRHSILTRLLELRSAVALGAFSYSIYLIHAPVLALVHAALRAMGTSTLTTFLVLIVIGVPASLAVAYLFHLAFEKPFLGRLLNGGWLLRRGGKPAAPAAGECPSNHLPGVALP